MHPEARGLRDLERSPPLHVVYARKSAQPNAFQEATSVVTAHFETLDGSRKETRSVTMSAMARLFKPMSDVIIRKYRRMEFLNSKLDVHKDMMERMRKCKDPH